MASGYEAETRGVKVKVDPSFLPEHSDPEEDRWVWAYTVQIENGGPDTIQLVDRPLDHHRRARPRGGGRGPGRGG
jgi:uncharacterized protein affecting Mg2+/Co2+ transport